MITVVATLLLTHFAYKMDPAQRVYNQVQTRLASCKAVMVVAGEEAYRFMGKRYRLDAPKLMIVCDGHKLFRKESDKPAVISAAPREWPDDLWLRGFEKLVRGPYPPQCTDMKKAEFASKPALSVDTRYSESPMFSSNLFFDAKTKLPLGYRAYSYGNLDTEVIYTKVDLHAKLKPSDFAIPKN